MKIASRDTITYTPQIVGPADGGDVETLTGERPWPGVQSKADREGRMGIQREKLRLLAVSAAAAIAACLSVVRAAEEWPQFRGVMAGVGVDHPDLPDSWGPTTASRRAAGAGAARRSGARRSAR